MCASPLAATDEHCIVYDDAALDRLLDRSQQGMEEKQMEMNDYLSSFKVAHYEKREIQDGDSEEPEDEDPNVEVKVHFYHPGDRI